MGDHGAQSKWSYKRFKQFERFKRFNGKTALLPEMFITNIFGSKAFLFCNNLAF